jgi:hypothetical protein
VHAVPVELSAFDAGEITVPAIGGDLADGDDFGRLLVEIVEQAEFHGRGPLRVQ